MNANFISKIVTACFSIMIFVSCKSHEQKADGAFEIVKQEKLLSKDSNVISKEIIEEPKKAEPVKKIETQDEWTKFKMETEKKILSNEKKIKEIKVIPNADAKLLRKITSLEKDNNDLRRQLDQYSEDVKVKWENFKATMNHDVNEIDIELKDIKINNKK